MAFKDLLNVFIEKEDELPKKEGITSTVGEKSQETSTRPVSISLGDTPGHEDPEMVKKLQESLIEKKLEGPDYLELLSTAKALEQFIPDETQRFSAALGQLKLKYGDGVSMIAIINTCNEYLNVLEAEKTSGLESCEAKRQSVIGPKRKELENLVEEAKEIDQKINDLMARKGTVVEETGKLQVEIGHLEAELNAKENNFNCSVESVKKKLQADIEKLKKLQ